MSIWACARVSAHWSKAAMARVRLIIIVSYSLQKGVEPKKGSNRINSRRNKVIKIVLAALGQKQPLNSVQILAFERLVSGHTGHPPLDATSGSFQQQAAASLV